MQWMMLLVMVLRLMVTSESLGSTQHIHTSSNSIFDIHSTNIIGLTPCE